MSSGLIILGIKVDDELAISPAVYFKSQKMKICFKKKQNQTKRPKNKFLQRESSLLPSTCRVKALSIAHRQLILNKIVQLIILNIFAQKILRWTMVDLYL